MKIKDALETMAHEDTPEATRWNMLAYIIKNWLEAKGIDMNYDDKDDTKKGSESIAPLIIFMLLICSCIVWLTGTGLTWVGNQGHATEPQTLIGVIQSQWHFIRNLKVW